MTAASFIPADWPAPKNIIAGTTTRLGGVSLTPYAELNLGLHVGDDPKAVAANRQHLQNLLSLPNPPCWLNQVHGIAVVEAKSNDTTPPTADGVYTHQKDQVCAIMTADCLPVLLCSKNGEAVGAAHAGWRGLQAGVIEAVISQLKSTPENIMAWLGPAIGPKVFEVGPEVREQFIAHDPKAAIAFTTSQENKYLADLYALARQRLQALGITAIYGATYCTYSDPKRFFSYRRDQGRTGRMASLIYIS